MIAVMDDRRINRLLMVSLALQACGARRVDLDSPAIVEPSSEPGVVAIVHERVVRLAIDDERLYWVGARGFVPGGPTPKNVLRSCKKRDCSATLVTYTEDVTGYGNFAVRGGQAYWDSNPGLLACPIAGCNGPPRTVATEGDFKFAAFDDDRVYSLLANSIASWSLLQPGPPQPIAPTAGFRFAIALQGAYAFWLATDGDETQVWRARKDSSLAVEVIASDVRHAGRNHFGFITDSTYVYWTNSTLVGSINRCPLAGCTGASETVLGQVRAPQQLLLDGSTLYYVYDAGDYQFTLASCALPACISPRTVLKNLNAPAALAVDDQYLYLATTETDTDTNPESVPQDPVAGIRRLRKTEQGLP